MGDDFRLRPLESFVTGLAVLNQTRASPPVGMTMGGTLQNAHISRAHACLV